MASSSGVRSARAASSSSDGHEKQRARISKPSMFMVVALWMERSPLAESPDDFYTHGDTKDHKCIPKKVGAVFVLPNDRALSVDCSRDGVHGAISALNKFGQDRARGCQVYLSRRPCSYCTKLLVQVGVVKVYYLPTEPEVNDPQDIKIVDNLFIVAAVGLSPFVPEVDVTVLDEQRRRQSPYTGHLRDEEAVNLFKVQLKQDHWNDEWIDRASQMLQSPFFNDLEMKANMQQNMENLVQWVARTTQGDVPDDIVFAEISDAERFECKDIVKPCGSEGILHPGRANIPAIPTPGEDSWQQLALHMTRMAQMLSQRSDDPTRGVGCVLMLKNEVVAIGWNGFPAKALYGEFPRAGSKEPYVIHAEQNALLTRNIRDLNPAIGSNSCEESSSQLYVSKIPCHECIPLLIQAGVRHIILPPLDDGQEWEKDEHKMFKCKLREKKLKAYKAKMKPPPQVPKEVKKTAKKLDL